MSNEIKTECQQIFAEIKELREKLAALRASCKHEHTFEGEYEWRTGSTYKSLICSACLIPVKNLERP